MIIGGKHFVTFDQQYYTLRGHCSFLLAKDFVKEEFSLVLKYDSRGHHTIFLLFDEHTVEIDLENDVSNRKIKYFNTTKYNVVRAKIYF